MKPQNEIAAQWRSRAFRVARDTLSPWLLIVVLALALCAEVARGQAPLSQPWKGRLLDGTEIDEEWMVAFLVGHRQAVANWWGRPRDYWQPLRGASLNGLNLAGLLERAVAELPGLRLERNALPLIDLSNASLDSAYLVGLWLPEVDLTHTRLTRSQLGNVYFSGAELARADFSNASADYARFDTVDATDSSFVEASLQGATFYCSTLRSSSFFPVHGEAMQVMYSVASQVRFYGASLRGAEFFDTELSGATLFDADVYQMNWGVRSPPELAHLAASRNLETLRFDLGESSLVALRKAFIEAGLRDGERKVNYALQRARDENKWLEAPEGKTQTLWNRLEVIFRKIGFDWSCRYGLHPGRCLGLIVGLGLLCAIPYAGAMLRAPRSAPMSSVPVWRVNTPPDTSQGGVWAVPLEKRIAAGSSEPRRVHIDLCREGWLRGLWHAAWMGLFFSAISAFSTGYRDLDVGRWIERIKREESTLRATGWVRTVSGLQSLVSFYLLALWLLTYFGRPFE